MKILLVGGGTGGHLYPLLVLAQEIKETLKDDVTFLYLGPVNQFSQKILEENGIKTKSIITAKWRRYWSLNNFIDIFKFPIGIVQSLYQILKFMPDVVFSKGGYGSVAPTLVARLYFIPVLIHESDAVPGKANRWMSKIADKIAISFLDSKKYFKESKILFTGNPVRKNIQAGSAEKARQIFNLHSEKPVILVLGGSQGSKMINQNIAGVLPRLLKSYQVIHQVGPRNLKEVEKIAGSVGVKISRSDYHPYEFLGEEIIHAYKVSQLVISRAGSSSIAEIAAVQKPSILIPIATSANNHQLYNAYFVARAGGAVILKEENFKKELLLTKIDQIMADAALRQKLSQNIARYYQPQAAQKIAQGLFYLAQLSGLKGKGLFKDQ